MMIVSSYQEFLDEPITISKNHFLTREDYYKIHMNGITPIGLFKQLLKIQNEELGKKQR